MFLHIHGQFVYNTCDSDSFHGQGCYNIKWHFQHDPLAVHIKNKVYLEIYHWISNHVFYRTEILFFILIPKYG